MRGRFTDDDHDDNDQKCCGRPRKKRRVKKEKKRNRPLARGFYSDIAEISRHREEKKSLTRTTHTFFAPRPKEPDADAA
jgi:hypothetical protein